jgi:hypothetical protein
MPDITMCDDKKCPNAPQCYRNPASGTRPSDFRQSWFVETPRTETGCEHFCERTS